MNWQLPWKKTPWTWVPTLYFAEGIPYIIVMFVATDMYKTLDVSNASLAFWTSILYLPWVLKPLWSPFVDLYSTKRNWILRMQFVLAFVFVCVALSLHLPWWYPASLVFLWMMAIFSATHDIAADGYYMIALNTHQQSFFTGIRSTFYRLAMIAGMGLLVMLTGWILDSTGLNPVRVTVQAMSVDSIGKKAQGTETSSTPFGDEPEILVFPGSPELPLYRPGGPDSTIIHIQLSSPPEPGKTIRVNFGHKKGSKDIFLAGKAVFKFDEFNWNQPQQTTLRVKHNLQKPASARFDAQSGDVAWSWSVSLSLMGLLFLGLALYHWFFLPRAERSLSVEASSKDGYWAVFSGFFRKKGILPALFFLLLYRFAESQLSKMASPFLLDTRENGGLALSLTEKGFAYGTVGLIALVLGGISGGIAASIHGLKKWIWWMAVAINLPNLVYVYLAYVKPTDLLTIHACIAAEQFGYGFGFTGYMLYMLYFTGQGKHKTAHFAIATGFMALGMMIPGMFSGSVQEWLGYQQFFIYIIACTIPSFITLLFIRIDPGFGMKKIADR